MGKAKPNWVKTDIPQDIKVKWHWRAFIGNTTYPGWQRALTKLDDQSEDYKTYVGSAAAGDALSSRDTYNALRSELQQMPEYVIDDLPADLQNYVRDLRHLPPKPIQPPEAIKNLVPELTLFRMALNAVEEADAIQKEDPEGADAKRLESMMLTDRGCAIIRQLKSRTAEPLPVSENPPAPSIDAEQDKIDRLWNMTFPDIKDSNAAFNEATANPEGFLPRMASIGQKPEAQLLLRKLFPTATDDQISELLLPITRQPTLSAAAEFAPVAPATQPAVQNTTAPVPAASEDPLKTAALLRHHGALRSLLEVWRNQIAKAQSIHPLAQLQNYSEYFADISRLPWDYPLSSYLLQHLGEDHPLMVRFKEWLASLTQRMESAAKCRAQLHRSNTAFIVSFGGPQQLNNQRWEPLVAAIASGVHWAHYPDFLQSPEREMYHQWESGDIELNNNLAERTNKLKTELLKLQHGLLPGECDLCASTKCAVSSTRSVNGKFPVAIVLEGPRPPATP